MRKTRGVHQFIEKHESFAELIAEIEEENRYYDLNSLLEEIGEEVYDADGLYDNIRSKDVGWLVLCWEAHHRALTQEEIPIKQ